MGVYMVYTVDEIRRRVAPIAVRYKIPSIYLFGSYARGDATEKSDVDLLIRRRGSAVQGLLMGALYNDLSESLQKPVDLVTMETLEQRNTRERTPWFIDTLEKERVLLYGQQ